MPSQPITHTDQSITLNPDGTFTQDLILKAALASNDIKDQSFDLKTAKDACSADIASINTKEGLQTMLSAQMLNDSSVATKGHGLCQWY